MKKKRVVISVINDLVGDNRVHKVATSLNNYGYDVLLVGNKKGKKIPLNREYKTHLIRIFFDKTFLFYAEYNLRLFFFLLFHKVDILLSNDLDTLLPNFIVSKIRRKSLVYDSHELFLELPELIDKPIVKKFWLAIEKLCLPNIKYSYTVCRSIADYYNKKYGISMEVVRNAPFLDKINKKKCYNDKKIIIYQGAVNIGRGLEEFIEAMKFLDNCIFWILGSGEIVKQLKKLVNDLNLNDKVVFHGRVKLEELREYTLKADLGISIEKNMGLNYYYALPNKIFDYIHAEIPVLCADLPEMSRIIKKYKVGEILKSHNPQQIAEQVTKILENNKQLEVWKENTKNAKNDLCWQNEQNQFLKIFEQI